MAGCPGFRIGDTMAKIKRKTHSGAKKRLSMTGTGKIKRKKGGKKHLNFGKGGARLRRLSEGAVIDAGHQRRVSRLLPNG